jgi:ABC-type multidrug transport system ATPase subunit
MNKIIETSNLTKMYGKHTAVRCINLNIHEGEIYGFLGPNGSGKTSTIKMLLGLSEPTEGEIYLFGQRASGERLDLRKRIGVVPEKHPVGVWTWMTGVEYLEFFARMFDVKNPSQKINTFLKKVELYEARNREFRTYSKGMVQRLSIVRALLHDPDILILDEPISGLDPFGVKQIRDLILDENREGRCIFVSSHMLSEVEKICHRIAIIYKGDLVAEGKMNDVVTNLTAYKEIYIDVESMQEGLLDDLRTLPFIKDVTAEGLTLTIEVPKDRDYRKDIALFIFNRGLIPIRIQEKAATLEDAFITITKESIEKLARAKECQ